MNLEDLKKPFPEEDLEWRVQSAGQKDGKVWARVLTYITNRAIMERLDSVVGAGNWKNEYREWMKDSILCGLSIKIDGEWTTKWDGADSTDIEATKGGLSGAMKRAGVQWGIGRYLYELDAGYAEITDKGNYYQAGKDGKYPAFRWNPPKLPKWALPESVFDRVVEHENQMDRYFDIEKSIDACDDLSQLKSLWSTLSKEEQKKFANVKEKRKKELTGE